MTERIYKEGDLSATRLDDGTYTIRHMHLGSLRLGADYLPAIGAVAADCGAFVPDPGAFEQIGVVTSNAQLQTDYETVTEVNMELKGEIIALKTALAEEAAQVAVLTAASIDLPPNVQLEVTNEVSVEEIPKASTTSSSDPSAGSDGG